MESVANQLKKQSSNGALSPPKQGRIAKLDSFYASRSASQSVDRLTFTNESTITRNAFRAANIKRWDGNRRTTSDWNDLRKVVFRVSHSDPLYRLLTITVP